MRFLFLKLLNMSLAGTGLLVLVSCISLFSRRIPKWSICILWGVVAIRLTYPETFEHDFSVVPAAQIVTENSSPTAKQHVYISTGYKYVDDISQRVINHFFLTEEKAKDGRKDYLETMSIIWLAGVIILLLRAFINEVCLYFRLDESVRVRKGILLSDKMSAPFVFGIIKPCIVLPTGLTDKEERNVIRHEKAHIQRMDQLWMLLGYTLLIIYWFNPVSWLAFYLFCRDIEYACDEKVIRKLDLEGRREYSETLLAVSASERKKIVLRLSFGEINVKKRIKKVLEYAKPKKILVCFSIMIVIGVAGLFLTTMPYKGQTKVTTIVWQDDDSVQMHKAEIELKKVLDDYDRSRISDVSVLLQNSETNGKELSVLVENEGEVYSLDEQTVMRDFLASYLDIEKDHVYLQCVVK